MIDELVFRSVSFSFFFFQAEDGIRDIGVTGVQTCALPILGSCRVPAALSLPLDPDDHVRGSAGAPLQLVMYGDFQCPYCLGRSEERRVGKECRSRWSPYH